eukprot:scaffold101559_cov60-Phaeocystis_antarctica.AAC.2
MRTQRPAPGTTAHSSTCRPISAIASAATDERPLTGWAKTCEAGSARSLRRRLLGGGEGEGGGGESDAHGVCT